jgi:hypothetical protein
MEMPRDLAASESRMPNLLFSVARSTSTGELDRKASWAEALGITCTDCLAASMVDDFLVSPLLTGQL